MSAAEQLSLASRAKKNAVEEMCRCGHFIDQHTRARKGCAVCGDECKRFRTRSRKAPSLPKGLEPPAGAALLKRQDTKREKDMGWVLVGENTLTAYLSQLKTNSLNVYKCIANARLPPMKKRFIMAGLANQEKAQRERAMIAIETGHAAGVAERGRPRKVVLTRISTGKLDGDNLQGALKHIRDGVAEGLLEESDKLFDQDVELVYAQAPPGKVGVRGVRIEIFW